MVGAKLKKEPHTGVAMTLNALIKLQLNARNLGLFKHKKVKSAKTGGYLAPLRGRGMEFTEVRAYQPGDDVRTIDWRVSARTGKPHTKLYQEEHERPVLLVVDYSSSMFFGTRVAFKSVIAAQAAALLAWAAIHHQDRIGGLLFSGKQYRELPTRGGQQGVLPLLKALADTPAPPSSHQQTGDFASALLRLRHLTQPGSLIFILSDFYTLDRTAELRLAELTTHHDVVAGFIYDPLEADLPPPNYYTLSDGTKTISIDSRTTALRAAYQQQFIDRKQQLQQVLRRFSIPLLTLPTDQAVVDNLLWR